MKYTDFGAPIVILMVCSATPAFATGPRFSEKPHSRTEVSCREWAKKQKNELDDFPVVTAKGVYHDSIPMSYAIDECLGRKPEEYFLLGASASVDEELCRKFPNIKYCVDQKNAESDPSPKWYGNRGGPR